MKLYPVIAIAAGIGAAMLPTNAPAQRTVVTIGAPTGAGWVTYRDRGYRRGWAGPRYYNGRGVHRGWYRWNNSYYRNCSYRWSRGHRIRDWHCW